MYFISYVVHCRTMKSYLIIFILYIYYYYYYYYYYYCYFSCFSCAHEECALAQRTAGSDVNIASCSAPRCAGFMRLKKNQKGYLLACSVSACKAVWWIPKCVRSGRVILYCAILYYTIYSVYTILYIVYIQYYI